MRSPSPAEPWKQVLVSTSYTDAAEILTDNIPLIPGTLDDIGGAVLGTLFHAIVVGGGSNDTLLRAYPNNLPYSLLSGKDVEPAVTWTLGTASYGTLYRTLWLPWESYGDGVILTFQGTGGIDSMTALAYAKRIRGSS